MPSRSPLPRGARTTFARRVLAAVRRVPPGRVATYGDIAAAAGRPGAARAVGNIMRECSEPGVPCHRVIAAGGLLGGFGGSPALKRALLQAEGILLRGARVKGFSELRWVPGRRTFARSRTSTTLHEPSRATRRGRAVV